MCCHLLSRLPIAVACVSVAMLVSVFAESPSSESPKPAAIRALQEFNVLIGGWRGVGQPKRGSQNGAWQERAESWEPAAKYWDSLERRRRQTVEVSVARI